MKENITHFDLEAAFKALDEIDIPVVKGGVRPNKVNLSETFRNRKLKTDLLIEDYYDLNSNEDMSEAQDVRDSEIAQAKLARIEKIVDLDAESPEDILPSYVGKYIIQCPQCMTLFYKDEADVVASDDDPKTVNVAEVCQHCGNDTGYMLIGKVGEAEEPVEETPVEEAELEAEAAEENAEEAEAEAEVAEENANEAEEAAEEAENEEDIDLSDLDFEIEEDEDEKKEESLNASKLAASDNASKNTSENVTLNEDVDLPARIDDDTSDDYYQQLYIDEACRDLDRHGYFDMADNTRTQRQIAEKIIAKMPEYLEYRFNNQAARRTLATGGTLGKRSKAQGKDFEIITMDEGTDYPYFRIIVVDKKDDQTKNEDVNVLSGNSIGNGDHNLSIGGEAVEAAAKIAPMLLASDEAEKADCEDGKCDYDHVELIEGTLDDFIDGDEFDTDVSDADIKKYKAIDSAIKDESLQVSKQTSENTSEETSENTTLNESSPDKAEPIEAKQYVEGEKTEVFTELPDYDVEVEQKGEKIEIELTPKDAEQKPEDDEHKEESDEVVTPEAPVEVPAEVAAFIDFDGIDEVDDEAIEECISKSLTEVYENVNNFKMSGCEFDGEKFMIEGVINFKSGNIKKTSYVFTEATKTNDAFTLIGINESLAADGKFTLNSKITDGKIIAESLNYKYTIDNTVVNG